MNHNKEHQIFWAILCLVKKRAGHQADLVKLFAGFSNLSSADLHARQFFFAVKGGAAKMDAIVNRLEAMVTRRSVQLAVTVAAIIAAGCATAASRIDATAFRVTLGCQISQVKVIVITNTTASPIAAGTQITYDAIRLGDGQHYGRTGGGPFLAPGSSLKIGGSPSSSCTAWYRRQLQLAP